MKIHYLCCYNEYVFLFFGMTFSSSLNPDITNNPIVACICESKADPACQSPKELSVYMDISKTDWKLFREKLPGWQEAYMERLNNEYVALLTSNEKASDKFWALDERIKQDRRRPGVILEMSKSNAVWNILKLIHDGVITIDNLCDFSSELKNSVSFLLDR